MGEQSFASPILGHWSGTSNSFPVCHGLMIILSPPRRVKVDHIKDMLDPYTNRILHKTPRVAAISMRNLMTDWGSRSQSMMLSSVLAIALVLILMDFWARNGSYQLTDPMTLAGLFDGESLSMAPIVRSTGPSFRTGDRLDQRCQSMLGVRIDAVH